MLSLRKKPKPLLPGKVDTMKKENIKIEGHVGTWYVIDETEWKGEKVYLLEHETYGDEAACLIVDNKLNIILEDVWNGLEELDY